MNTNESQLKTLLSPLQNLEASGLPRPPSMSLATYLSHLASYLATSPEEVSLLLSHYYGLRFAREVFSAETLQPSIQTLVRMASDVQQASEQQRKQWTEALQAVSTPIHHLDRLPDQPVDTRTTLPHTESSHAGHLQVPSSSSTVAVSQQSMSSDSAVNAEPQTQILSAATRVAISSNGTNFSVASGSRAFASPQIPGSSSSTTESKSKSRSSSVQKDLGTLGTETTPVVGRFQQWLSRPLRSHLWWILLLLFIMVILSFWNGVTYSDQVILRSYQIQNWVSLFFGFPPVTIPDRYLPEHLRYNARRDRNIRRFTRYIMKRHPNNARLWRRLAYYYQEQEKYAEAIAFYSRTLSLDPKNIGALNDLAWILCTADQTEYRDPLRALRLAERAYALQKTADITDTLAEAAFLNGQVQRAVELAKKALALEPKENHFREQLERFQKALPKPVSRTPTTSR